MLKWKAIARFLIPALFSLVETVFTLAAINEKEIMELNENKKEYIGGLGAYVIIL